MRIGGTPDEGILCVDRPIEVKVSQKRYLQLAKARRKFHEIGDCQKSDLDVKHIITHDELRFEKQDWKSNEETDPYLSKWTPFLNEMRLKLLFL